MTRSGSWRKGVAFVLILLMLFMFAAISTTVVVADSNPNYTYVPASVRVVLNPGVEDPFYHPWNLTIGIYWGDAVPRAVSTGMGVKSVDPEDAADSFIFSFDPQSFTLDESNGYSQTVAVTVFAKEGATEGDYITKIVADDLEGGTPVIAEGGGCHDYIRVVPEGECFIATAAYGSYLDSHVQTLRDFRDQYLLTNPVSSVLVSAYYKTSPPIADFIDDHPALKPIVRIGLLPAVALTTVVVSTTLVEKMAIAGGLALVSMAIAMWLRRRARRMNI